MSGCTALFTCNGILTFALKTMAKMPTTMSSRQMTTMVMKYCRKINKNRQNFLTWTYMICFCTVKHFDANVGYIINV